MDVIKTLEADIKNGFSKSDLEKLIGLPKNSLSGVLNGNKKLSKKSVLKIEKWNKSEKPNPLEIVFVKPTSESYDVKKVNRYKLDEVGTWKSPDKHPLYKEGDPSEGSMAFFMKYGVSSYDEIKSNQDK